MRDDYYPFVNLPLPYGYGAMEPYIDEKTMRVHHDGHLEAYVSKLNAALKERPGLQMLSLAALVRGGALLGEEVARNAGGVYNHRFYFELLQNPADREPHGALRKAIERDFGGFAQFREAFKKAALSVFGSGYAWLAAERGRLAILTTGNQDNPLQRGMKPVLNVDVWEHAYYLKHQYRRADYIEDWFKIINWPRAESNFLG